jgi:hypothetical protein
MNEDSKQGIVVAHLWIPTPLMSTLQRSLGTLREHLAAIRPRRFQKVGLKTRKPARRSANARTLRPSDPSCPHRKVHSVEAAGTALRICRQVGGQKTHL